MNIVLIITSVSLCYLVIERFIILRRVKTIRYRIHVNGTRGKSSVSRYIGAVLTVSGMKTMVKITGIIPTIYLPDGTSQTIVRRGKARVQEQVSVISRAFKHRVDALVLECMSLKPEYQQLETRILRPHITVITNIEDDHREEMGATVEEHVEAIASSIPFRSVVITSETRHVGTLMNIADQRGTTVHIAPPLSPELSAQLPLSMFPANVSIALAVAGHLGIDQQRAFDAIKALDVQDEHPVVTINGNRVRFINGFAVNDVPSAERFLERWNADGKQRARIIILNTRNDRPLRTIEFLTWCSSVKDLQHLFITGTHAEYSCRVLKKNGFPHSRFSRVAVRELFTALQTEVRSDTDIIGLANISGDGFAISELFNMKAEHTNGH